MNDNWEPRWPFHTGARVLRVVGLVIAGVVAAGIFALAFGWFVMLLWNWLMPAVFGLGVITYWQAFGIVILAKLIFGAVGGRGRYDHRRPHDGRSRADWGGRERWRYWREFWEQEGRAAFDRFVEQRRAEGPAGPEKPAGPGGTQA
jgi:hypothetical protein